MKIITLRQLLYIAYTSPIFKGYKRIATQVFVDKKAGLTLYHAIFMIIRQLRTNLLVSHSKAVAYNFTLAIFPMIIFLFTLIPYLEQHLHLEQFTQSTIMGYLATAIPPDMYDEIESTIMDIISNKQGDLMSFGFFFSLLMATNGMSALMQSFNLIYRTTDKRGLINKQIVALFLTITLSLVLFSAFIVLIFGDSILALLSKYGNLTELIVNKINDFRALEFLVFGFLFMVAVGLIYYFAPAVKNRWKFFSIGTIFASISILMVSLLFSFYINNFSSYNKVYGSIGTLIGFMIWVQAIAYILIVGYIINAGIDEAKEKIILKKVSANLEVNQK